MIVYWVLIIAAIVVYIAANFFKDPEVTRNVRLVGIVLYLGSGVASLNPVALAITVLFSGLWIWQTLRYYKQDKRRQQAFRIS